MPDAEGRLTPDEMKEWRAMEERIEATRAKDERARAEARGELDAERARKIADDLDDWRGRDPWRDPLDDIIERALAGEDEDGGEK